MGRSTTNQSWFFHGFHGVSMVWNLLVTMGILWWTVIFRGELWWDWREIEWWMNVFFTANQHYMWYLVASENCVYSCIFLFVAIWIEGNKSINHRIGGTPRFSDKPPIEQVRRKWSLFQFRGYDEMNWSIFANILNFDWWLVINQNNPHPQCTWWIFHSCLITSLFGLRISKNIIIDTRKFIVFLL